MASVSWDLVHDAVRLREPARIEEPVATRAAVAAILRGEEENLELLFMRRAEQEGDPWSGHISFPGGRAEPGKEDPLQTAVRETEEETGIDLGRDAELLGPLDEIRAMARGRPVDLSIAPFVFRLLKSVNGTPNHEVVSLHWLPLARLLDEECRSTMEYEHEGTTLEAPCLRIDELVIWGLTYRMFDNLRQLVQAAAAGPQPLVRLVDHPIDVAGLLETSPGDGAACLFVGVVRNENDGRQVERLEYEAYEEMAVPLMKEIAAETKRRFPVTEVRLVHRVGRLAIGETSVAVAVASPHRAEAFEACRFAIDELKATVPIWKKEYYADGTAWLEGPGPG